MRCPAKSCNRFVNATKFCLPRKRQRLICYVLLFPVHVVEGLVGSKHLGQSRTGSYRLIRLFAVAPEDLIDPNKYFSRVVFWLHWLGLLGRSFVMPPTDPQATTRDL